MRVDDNGPWASVTGGTRVRPMPSASAWAPSVAVLPPRRRPKAKSAPQARCRAPRPRCRISSSRIRRALQDGYPERATAELGRPWAIRGAVAHGDKRGRTIGFPTANVALGRHLEPARGVYAVTVRLPDGAARTGVANIGRRPTVNAGPESRLEVNLFDFDADLYGQDIGVALHAFIRPEQKFPGLDALRAQIAADAAEARRILDHATPPSA